MIGSIFQTDIEISIDFIHDNRIYIFFRSSYRSLIYLMNGKRKELSYRKEKYIQ